jgi:radical SAM enzyme (TIGR01210 family)
MAASAEIRSLRGARADVALEVPQAVWDEEETASPGVGVSTRVMLLTGGECRFTCSMCDLWKHTLPTPTPPGILPQQIRHGLAHPAPGAKPPRWIKLYNGSNFFDHRSVPREDLPEIASLVASFERVVVENHPRLCSEVVPAFRDQLSGQLEVAMGLETAHPEALAALNKQMTLDDMARACETLAAWGVDTRAFVLLGVPGIAPDEAVAWCLRSVAFARECGIRHVSIVPLRRGNGWVDRLLDDGPLRLPTAADLEAVADAALSEPSEVAAATATVVTIDLWDFPTLAGSCDVCRPVRQARLAAMNLTQRHISRPDLTCGCQA